MKLTLKLTLDGLMRALRVREQRLAEEIEAGRIRPDDYQQHRWTRARRIPVSERNGGGGSD